MRMGSLAVRHKQSVMLPRGLRAMQALHQFEVLAVMHMRLLPLYKQSWNHPPAYSFMQQGNLWRGIFKVC